MQLLENNIYLLSSFVIIVNFVVWWIINKLINKKFDRPQMSMIKFVVHKK